MSLVGDLGITGRLAGLFLLTDIASRGDAKPGCHRAHGPHRHYHCPGPGCISDAFMMLVAIAASASFLSPVGHPANVLIMGPGGYKFSDYIKVGLPLTAVVLLITLFTLPILAAVLKANYKSEDHCLHRNLKSQT